MQEHPVKRLRAELGLSQGDFARRLDVNAMTVSRWERGETVPQRRHWSKLSEIGLRMEDVLAAAQGGEQCTPP